MSYNKRTWANGNVVGAVDLNRMERGVSTVSGTYEPTTWENGDVFTAEKLNNIEQGIVNAGGGSSDFSTANVTINIDEGFSGEGIVAFDFGTGVDYLINDEYDGYQYAYNAELAIGDTLSQNPPELPSINTITLLLYMGQCYLSLPINGTTTSRSFVSGTSVSVTGNATLDQENSRVIITGDCTITVDNWIMT